MLFVLVEFYFNMLKMKDKGKSSQPTLTPSS